MSTPPVFMAPGGQELVEYWMSTCASNNGSREGLIHGLVIAAAAFALCWPLFFTGYSLGHSGGINILYADQFIRALDSGVLIPGWMRDANAGNGSPIYIFYQPFIFYTAALIAKVVPDVPLALNLSAFVAMLASGLVMYSLSRLMMGARAALVAAILYMALPYHLVDMYERGALSEHWAFLWMAATMYFTQRAFTHRRSALAGLAITYALLVPTHLPSTLLFTPFLIAYFVFLYAAERSRSAFILRMAGLTLGIGLSCVYLMPAMLDQGNIKIAHTFSNYYLYANNFLFLSGQAFDQPFVDRLGLIAAALLAMQVALIVVTLRTRKTAPDGAALALFMLGCAAAAVLMSTPISAPLWRMLPQLQKVQFPWRYLALATLATSLGLGIVAGRVCMIGRGALRAAAVIIVAASLALSFYYSADQYKRYAHMPFLDPSVTPKWTPGMDVPLDRLYEYAELFAPAYKYMAMPIELTPRWAKDVDGTTLMPSFAGEARFAAGRGTVSTKLWEPELRVLSIHAEGEARLLVKTFYYPNWHAYSGGVELPLAPDERTGLISIELPAGNHTLTIAFERSFNQKLGIALTLLSALSLAIACARL